MSITRQKFCYLVVLNKKFLTLLASDLLLQIEQVLSQHEPNLLYANFTWNRCYRRLNVILLSLFNFSYFI
ncbi:hypothetical protein EAG18_16855 [Pseudoalteromonas sp. J010]|nr:hypothetical protein EAG18_16855 [Pseudoalteromonas sp. J010]